MTSRFKVVFVLGGPGSGKGTQSVLIQEKFKFKHLSAGQLLRQQKARHSSEYGRVIDRVILEGKIVPSSITTKLLQTAIQRNEGHYRHFLIDGYPRNIENLQNWKSQTKQFAECPFVLHFRCSKEEMIRRILKRGESGQRSDDNLEVISKRLDTYYTETFTVLEQFQKGTKVHQVNSDETPSDIFEKVCPIFQNFWAKNKCL